MELTTGANIEKQAILDNFKKLTNQIFKLLPNWEEGLDWETPLNTIIEELSGMDILLKSYHKKLFPLICKLQGLHVYTDEEDFSEYRRTIFECLNILSSIKDEVEQCQD